MNRPTLQNEIRSATPEEHPNIGPRDMILPLASPPLRRTLYFVIQNILL
jgi:hypothetical protein